MQDITTRKDIEFLVASFYTKVKQDKQIGYFFTEIANLDFDSHLPVMCDFWENIIFKKAIYKGNPMLSHIHLHKKMNIESFHFEKWLRLWEQTLIQNFVGENANEALQRAKQIASLIQLKLSRS